MKLNNQTIHEITDAIRRGYNAEHACSIAGIEYSQFEQWMDAGSNEKSEPIYRNLFVDVLKAVDSVMSKKQSLGKKIEEATNDTRGGYVYFVRDVAFGKIKIGYAKSDLDRRLNTLQAGCPQEIQLVAFIRTKNANKLEKELHRKYASKHYRGEWFDITDKDIDLVIEYYDGVYVGK